MFVGCSNVFKLKGGLCFMCITVQTSEVCGESGGTALFMDFLKSVYSMKAVSSSLLYRQGPPHNPAPSMIMA